MGRQPRSPPDQPCCSDSGSGFNRPPGHCSSQGSGVIGKALLVVVIGALLAFACLCAWMWFLFKDVEEWWGE